MVDEKKYSILLVEDEENLHEALKLNLELEGYEVTSAYSGASALKAVESEYFDLIIMDVMLPEIDGINVTETIRLKHIDVPILILSAKNTSADRVLGLKKGADDYLSKPVRVDVLQPALRFRILRRDDLHRPALVHPQPPLGDVEVVCAPVRHLAAGVLTVRAPVGEKAVHAARAEDRVVRPHGSLAQPHVPV